MENRSTDNGSSAVQLDWITLNQDDDFGNLLRFALKGDVKLWSADGDKCITLKKGVVFKVEIARVNYTADTNADLCYNQHLELAAKEVFAFIASQQAWSDGQDVPF